MFEQDNKPSKSVLFLFVPRQIANHGHRSMQYNFRPAVLDAVIENIIRKPTMSNNVEHVIGRCAEVNQAIVPSSNPFEMNTSIYSDCWTFCLMTDVAESNVSNLMTRYVSIGVCLGEPVGNRGVHSQTPETFCNPQCQMMITKQVVVNKHSTLGPDGEHARIKTLSDLSVVAYDQNVFNSHGNAPDYYMMTPATVARSVVIDAENNITSVANTADALNVKIHENVQASIESPKRHMRELLMGFESEMQRKQFHNQVGDFGIDAGSLHDFSDDFCANIPDTYDTMSINNNVYQQNSGIITDGINTLGMIMAKYNPQVNVVNTPPKVNADVLPQNITSPSTIFSSMICAIIPTHLNAVNLSAVGMMYNSWNDATQILHLEAAVECDQQQLQFMWKRFEFILKNEVYPILKANCGEFDLQIMSSISGTTDCILNFYDFEPLPVGTIYQENSFLGGLISPLIGTTDTLVSNGYQLNRLVKGISDNMNYADPNQY